MSLLVKVCGLRDAEHVHAAIGAGADALGFVFAESVRQVSAARAVDLCRDVPSHVRRVAVMLHPTNAQWQEVLQTFVPDVLQTDAEDFAQLQMPVSLERWPVYREGQAVPGTDGSYLYEGSRSGHGQTVDWSQAASLALRGQMILAGGLRADNVAEAVTTVRPFGVDTSSGVETEPGRKNTQRISEFVNAARAAENLL